MNLKLLIIILPTLVFSSTLLITTASADDENTSGSILSETNITKKAPSSAATDKQQTVDDFSFSDLHGKKHNFSDYRGKWVIVNYWATYCPPCRVEVTDLNIFAEANKKNAVVLGFDAGGDPISALKDFKQEYELNYTMAPAQDSTLLSFGIIDRLPMTFVVSPQGKITNLHVGMITFDDLADYTKTPRRQ